MEITKTVSFEYEEEVSIELGIDDIAEVINEGVDDWHCLLSTISNFATVLAATPDAAYDQMTDGQRELLCNFYKKQLARLDV